MQGNNIKVSSTDIFAVHFPVNHGYRLWLSQIYWNITLSEKLLQHVISCLDKLCLLHKLIVATSAYEYRHWTQQKLTLITVIDQDSYGVVSVSSTLKISAHRV